MIEYSIKRNICPGAGECVFASFRHTEHTILQKRVHFFGNSCNSKRKERMVH